jgi:hypothetical protein
MGRNTSTSSQAMVEAAGRRCRTSMTAFTTIQIVPPTV